MNKIWKKIGLVISVSMLIISLIMLFVFYQVDNSRTIEYEYELNVNPDQTGNYTVYVHYPVTGPQQKTIVGVDSLSYIETEYGKMMKIESQGSIHILYRYSRTFYPITGDNEDDHHMGLNMQKGGLYFYLDGISNASVEFEHSTEFSSDGYAGNVDSISYVGMIENGWNHFNGTEDGSTWDGMGWQIFIPIPCSITGFISLISVIVLTMIIFKDRRKNKDTKNDP